MEEWDSSLKQILDLLFAAGYVDATKPDVPPAEKLAGGLAWCIAAVNAASESDASKPHPHRTITDDRNTQCIEADLRFLGCPYPLQPSNLRNLDTQVIFPVIQWLVMRVKSRQENDGALEVCHSEQAAEGDDLTFQNQNKEFEKIGISIKTLSGNLDELNHRKTNVVKELDHLRERISKEGADTAVQKLVSLMASLEDLETRENQWQSHCDSKHSELQTEINELERKIANGYDSKSLSDGLHHSLSESLEKLILMKKELAVRLRSIVAVRRQIDDLPCQSELIQYERRFSELYAQIQRTHQQTGKYYATYNALLEVKELMLKETSLLNSIISQFQQALSSTDGRTKLIHSMEGIVKGSQQKLEKVQLGLQEEERILNDVKERYAAVVGGQKRCYSLLKAFQEGCSKNEKLRCQSSKGNC